MDKTDYASVEIIIVSVEFRLLFPGEISVVPGEGTELHFFNSKNAESQISLGHLMVSGGSWPPPSPPPEFNAANCYIVCVIHDKMYKNHFITFFICFPAFLLC